MTLVQHEPVIDNIRSDALTSINLIFFFFCLLADHIFTVYTAIYWTISQD